MRRAIVVLANAYSWEGDRDYCLSVVDGRPVIWHVLQKLTSVFPEDSVVVAVPDIPENSVFETITDDSGVTLHKGSTDNVLERIISAADLSKPEYIIVVNAQHFFLDTELLLQLIAEFEKSFPDIDYVKCPNSFDVKYTADVVATEALCKMQKLHDSGIAEDVVLRRPVSSMMYYRDYFSIKTYQHLPHYSVEKKKQDRVYADLIFPQRKEYQADKADKLASISLKRYNLACEYVSTVDRVLDIACGAGYGSEMFAQKAQYVVGADICSRTIATCSRKFISVKNLEFVAADVTRMPFKKDEFSVMVSMETIEHVDEELFIAEAYRVLAPGGLLLISTPNNIDGEWPLISVHLKEYYREELISLLANMFDVIKEYHFYNGVLLEPGDEGNNMMMVCRKR